MPDHERYGVPSCLPEQPTEADAALWDAAARRAAEANDWGAARALFEEVGRIWSRLGGIPALIYAHAYDPIPVTGDPALDGFFERALAKAPADRFQSGAELATTYGAKYERLRRVKAAYDPDNTLHLNQNISPA